MLAEAKQYSVQLSSQIIPLLSLVEGGLSELCELKGQPM